MSGAQPQDGQPPAKRGAIVTVAVAGDCGKPRPAVVIQSDRLAASDSILVCLLTTMRRDAPLYRLPLDADVATGLRLPSDVMVDKIMAVPRAKIGAAIGLVSRPQMARLDRMLALAVGLADGDGA